MALLLLLYSFDSTAQHDEKLELIDTQLERLSFGVSIVLLLLYGLYLSFQHRTHAALYDDDDLVWNEEEQEYTRRDTQEMGFLNPLTAMAYATISFGLMAMCVVNLIPSLDRSVTTLVYGLFIVPVCLKAAVHSFAIKAALCARMDDFLSSTMDGAIRMVFLFCPIFFFVAKILRQPTTLLFGLEDVLATMLATWIVAPILGKGKTNFLDGALLLAMYEHS